MFFGGGGDQKHWEGFITSAKKSGLQLAEQKENIKKWLENRSEIENVEIGELKDSWND